MSYSIDDDLAFYRERLKSLEFLEREFPGARFVSEGLYYHEKARALDVAIDGDPEDMTRCYVYGATWVGEGPGRIAVTSQRYGEAGRDLFRKMLARDPQSILRGLTL